MKKLLIASVCVILAGCSTESPYNPFVCSTAPQDDLMVHSLQAKTINPEALATGTNLGVVKVSASTFGVDANFLNMVNLAMAKLGADDVLVVNTDIDACNQLQYLYAKFILTQALSHGFKTNKIIFVDKQSGEVLQADKEASVSFEFIVVDKNKL